MLASTGQLTPCIGRRVAEHRVMLYAGQRRLLAARASHELVGTPEFEGLAPVTSLIVLLLDHEPGDDEIRRIQAQENAREALTLRDQQEQFRDCWQARAGLPDTDRMAVVCADLGISTGKGHSLRRQLALPDAIRDRIAERPADDQLSVRMAHRLADMHDIAPELTEAVATRVTTASCTTRRCATSAASSTAPSSRTSTSTRSGSTTASCSTAPSRSSTRATTSPPSATPRPPPRSAARPTSSTPSSTRSPPAPRAARSSCASTGRCATAPHTAATAGCSSAARISPPASG